MASIRPLTAKDIDNINLNDWNFRPFREIEKEWENAKQKRNSKRIAGSNRKVQESTTEQEEEATTILH